MGRSSYPGQFDSDVELPRVDNNITDMGGEAINALRDAIFSIENTVGVNPQGNMADLVTRINRVIDDNGNILTSALATRGLVALPITNAQIDINAGIEERKLDLDYPTTTLYGIIQSSQTDIDAMRISFNAFTSRTMKHFLGTSDRHDGYQIDLQFPVMSKTTAEMALHELANAFTIHAEDLSFMAHPGANISLSNDFQNIDADNVQVAVEQLDTVFAGLIDKHQDILHANGIGINTSIAGSEQINTAASVLGSTIFKTETSKATNILQVMRPNVARITGKNIDTSRLIAGISCVLRIQAGGIGRTYLDINLTAIIPTDDVDKIVEAINTTAHGCSNHYPISAYNTNGQITIAHNIPGEEFTITILDSVAFSAASALGFGEVVSIEAKWSAEEHAGYVAGHRIKDLKSLIKVHYNHIQRPPSTISLGLGSLAQYGIAIGNEGRVICNITNHSTTPTDNGSHYIVAFLNNETFALSADLAAGECDIEICADSVNFQNSANGEIYDIFVESAGDGYGIVTKQNRVSYGPIAGISLKSISKDFPTDNVEWQVDDNNYLQLFENDIPGVPVFIPIGYLGQIEVLAPDNINKAIVELTSTPSVLKRDLNVSLFGFDNDKLYLSSVHYGGNFGIRTLKYVTDKRLLGSSLENKSQDVLSPLAVEDALNELHTNGVIRGFDVMSYSANSFKVRGGKALVNGRMLNVPTQDITVSDFAASTRLLLLDRFGNFITKSQYDPGFTMAELIAGDGYGDERGVVPLLEFETNGTALDGYFYDRRFMIGNIDKRLYDATTSIEQEIMQVKSAAQGSAWANTVASYTAEEMSALPDDYVASLKKLADSGLLYIVSANDYNPVPLPTSGFGGGSIYITTRRFELYNNMHAESVPAKHIVRAPGMSHINVFASFRYYGESGGPFGVSETVKFDIGVATTVGMTTPTTTEAYATARTMTIGVLPSNSITENYVVSVPISQLGISENTFFNVIPRVRIENSIKVDGGPGSDPDPVLEIDHIRVVTSSYSIAGRIIGADGTIEALAATIGETL